MKFKTYVTEDAEADIRNASIWYDEQSPGLGDRFLRAYEYSKNSIQDNPYKCVQVKANVRRAILKRFPYCVFYVIHEAVQEVEIFAVVHAKRHPRVWQKRKSK